MANLLYLNQYKTTTLSVVGGIDASQTTSIVIQSTSGIDTTKPGIACLSYTDPINTDNAEWIEYEAINSTTNTFTGVTRGSEGYSAKTHSNGVTVAFPMSESNINRINQKLNGNDPIDQDLTLSGDNTLSGSNTVSGSMDFGDSMPSTNVRASVYKTSEQTSIANDAVIAFEAETYDDGSDFDLSNNYFTAPTDGAYDINVNLLFSDLADQDKLNIAIEKDTGSGFSKIKRFWKNASGTNDQTHSIGCQIKLDSGDKIRFVYTGNSTPTIYGGAVNGAEYSHIQIRLSST